MRYLLNLFFAAALAIAPLGEAWATTTTYQYKDNAGTLFNVLLWQCMSGSPPTYCTGMVPEDSSGNEKATAANPWITEAVTPSIATTPTAPLSVTSTTGRQALGDTSGSYGTVLLTNDGSADLYYALGNGSVTATTSSTRIAAGRGIEVPQNGATNVAAITAAGSTTLGITQFSGPAIVTGAPGGSGGATGNVNLNQVGGAGFGLGQTAQSASLSTVQALDTNPSSQTLSAADAASTTVTGANGMSYYTGTPTANSAAAQAISGQGSDVIGVTSSNFIGTIQFELQDTNGDWFAAGAWQRGAGSTVGPVVTSLVATGGTTATGVFELNVSGKTGVRARVTAYTSGTASVTHTLSPGTSAIVRNESPVRVIDNVSGAQATVKPASTASAQTDTGVVTRNPDIGTISDATGCASTNTVSGCLKQLHADTTASVPAGTNLIGNVGVGLPAGATATQGSNTGTTAATSTTLPAASGVTEYVCGISVRANATAAATGNATLSDGTVTYNFTQWTAPLASGVGVIEEIFNPCHPATAVNTAWTLTSAAPGSGGTVSVAIDGYEK